MLAVLRIGSTSGGDMLTGMIAGLELTLALISDTENEKNGY